MGYDMRTYAENVTYDTPTHYLTLSYLTPTQIIISRQRSYLGPYENYYYALYYALNLGFTLFKLH